MKKTLLYLVVTSIVFFNNKAISEDILYVIEKKEEKINEKTLNSEQLEKNLIFSMEDIVRHLPGVGVSSEGRFGNNGYAIRGVDKDRVAIQVDDIPQAETFDNTIYKGYGYFNGSMNDIETEHLKSVIISKGADSIFSGSGALGGAVKYVTKDPADLISEGNWGFVSRSVYTSKNNEKMQTIGIATSQQDVEGMLLYVYRNGHETNNYKHENDIFGSARGTPDPQEKTRHSLLSKINLLGIQNHKIGATFEYSEGKTYTDEKSWYLFSSYYRTGDDLSKRIRYTLSDTWTPERYIDSMTTSFNWQKIEQKAFSSTFDEHYNGHYYDIFEENSRNIIQYGRFINNEIVLMPLSLFNTTHSLALRTSYSTKTLNNKNTDTKYLGKPKVPYQSNYSIIRPVYTQDISIAFVDEIKMFDDKLNVVLGSRYDNVSHHTDNAKLSLAKDSDLTDNHYQALSLALSTSYKITPNYTFQYKIGQGFRIPTAQELYFDYGGNDARNRLEPNPNLKQEKGLSNEISLSYNNDKLFNKVNVYYTKYNNFIDLKQSEKQVPNPWYDPNMGDSYWNKPTLPQNHLQYSNVASAYVYGFELTNEIRLSKIFGLDNTYILRNTFNYTRGKDASGDSLLSVQPFKWVSSLSYDNADKKYGAGIFMTYSARKEGNQAIRNGREWPYLSDSYTVFDTTAYYNVNKNIVLRAGVFNLFNRKYSTWDALRSLPEFGTTNQIDRDRLGLQRFTAPGRNFSMDISLYF